MWLPLPEQVTLCSSGRPVFFSCPSNNMLLLPVCTARGGLSHELLGCPHREAVAPQKVVAEVFDVVQYHLTYSR